jgi:glycosyltransferase involved in cell wall biosynthesis
VRIAQVAPLFESVPPRLYGGTERVVSYLTEELVALGHDVTLFAAGDSCTSATLVPACDRALRLDPRGCDDMVYHVLELELLRRQLTSFDVVHYHLDALHFPLARSQRVPHVTTMHSRLDRPGLFDVWREVAESPMVSISHAQRRPLPFANWQGTIHHGMPAAAFTPSAAAGDYLLFVGRISREKRVDRAIEIARRAGMRLIVAAKISAEDRDYAASVAPLLDEPFVDFLGEVGPSQRDELMAGAYGLLFPIDWPEPFGLVMIESMARGTPVLAWPCGSVPEIVEPGVTGELASSLDEAIPALERLGRIDRRACSDRARDRFNVGRMAQGYLRVYERVADLRGRVRTASAMV